MKYFHDLKSDISSKILRIGDLVMIKATTIKNKLQNRSYKPYKIIEINNTSITLVRATGKDQTSTTSVPMERVIRIPELSHETAINHPHYPQTSKNLNKLNSAIKYNCNMIKLSNLAEMEDTSQFFASPADGSHEMDTVESPSADQVPLPTAWECAKMIGEQRRMVTRSQSSKLF